ncbi:MAG: RNA polymerase sigma factor SigZ [Gemmataceae bacterium]|nr:RNA polymerase sigma factor SigZ [Gemmataceae bacterium]
MTTQPTTDMAWAHLSADLRRFIRRRVADDHLADDLLQETFVRIHRHIGALQETDRLAAWVYQIARNVLQDHYRWRSRNEVALSDTVAANDGRLSYRCIQAGAWLEELVRQLPETYRQAVQLSEIDGLLQREVADRLGLSLAGAKSRIQRGRALLKQALDDCCRFEFDRRGNLLDCDPKPDRTVCKDCDT